MALVTLKRFPTADEFELCNLGSNLSLAIDLLAKTFPKPRVQADIEAVDSSNNGIPELFLGVWADGLVFPFDWFHVTHLNDEDKKELARDLPHAPVKTHGATLSCDL